jgi:hypothetical protein
MGWPRTSRLWPRRRRAHVGEERAGGTIALIAGRKIDRTVIDDGNKPARLPAERQGARLLRGRATIGPVAASGGCLSGRRLASLAANGARRARSNLNLNLAAKFDSLASIKIEFDWMRLDVASRMQSRRRRCDLYHFEI